MEGKRNEMKVERSDTEATKCHDVQVLECKTAEKMQEFLKKIEINKIIEQSYCLKDKYTKSNNRFITWKKSVKYKNYTMFLEHNFLQR